ncbi:RagB/SusD family nutrient uptake outer membrane protein [Pedobacter yonginense]|uniref:RagB/SusD family nutrient uptake outer membrane protein n=1 Tax=Pedobacter yonginense TaxID=651869 RepID=A0A317EQM3_9SPHI|nr:RagB/SusD family nutrient uptake outer membrane protein [Pedobacter yonginense]PWS29190.1 RagB/SusD family nutrient uptake outer membrane protein [Pedobacter yonginense]
MKKNIFYLVFMLVAVCATSCKKESFLQDGSFSGTNDITEAQLWANPDYSRNFLNNVYSVLSDRYNLDDGALLASGSDEAVNSNLNSSINILNNGTWSPSRTFDEVYAAMYVGIRKANMFLEKVDGSAIIPIDEVLPANVPANQTYAAQVDRLKGQAFFLRAFFQFELLKRYGSFPIATRTLSLTDDLDLPRNSFDECAKQIAADCEEAILRLPLSPTEWRATDRGRATQTAAMALKARLLLYAASPQYNPSNDLSKWQAAADAAKRIMDTNKHAIYTSYPNIWLWNVGAFNSETIFATSTLNTVSIETNNAPISYDAANGRTNPTQELVDAFEMKTTGKPISDAGSGYLASNPYANRDPRLGFTVFYNSASIQPALSSNTAYVATLFKAKPVETFVGGKDGLGLNVNATKTGYYMRKYLSESAVWAGTVTNVRRPWIFFRYAEVLLNYAEALNEAQGVGAQTEILRALNFIRDRNGVKMPLLQTTNPAGNGYVIPSQAEFRKRIRNERRVELCFEEHRFYDVRRWKEGEITFNKPVTGMRIVQTSATTFSYTPFTVENRVFTAKNYLYPISQNELNKAPKLGQNPGY